MVWECHHFKYRPDGRGQRGVPLECLEWSLWDMIDGHFPLIQRPWNVWNGVSGM